MSERWTDKKRGEIGDPGNLRPDANSLSFTRNQREILGGLDQTEAQYTIPEGTVRVKGFGNYEQVFFEPTRAPIPSSGLRIFLYHSDRPWEFMVFNIDKVSGGYRITKTVPNVAVLRRETPHPTKIPVPGIQLLPSTDTGIPYDLPPAVIKLTSAVQYISAVEYESWHNNPYSFTWTRTGDLTTKDEGTNYIVSDLPFQQGRQHASITPVNAVPLFPITGIYRICKNDIAKYGPFFNPTPMGGSVSLVENTGRDIAFGRIPYTLEGQENRVDTFHERIVISRYLAAVEVMSSDVVPDWALSKCNFFFPWIPYLHETPTFSIQDFNNGVFSEEPRAPRTYAMAYDQLRTGGSVVKDLRTGDILKEEENFSVTDTYSPDTTSDRGSGFWNYNETVTRRISMNGSMCLYEPLGTIGLTKAFYIENQINLQGSIDLFSSLLANASWDPVMDFYWGSGCTAGEPFLIEDGSYDLTMDDQYDAEITHVRSMQVTQKLMFGNIEIEEAVSSFAWEASDTSHMLGQSGKNWKRCDTLCNDVFIGYTSGNMRVGECQTLSVINGNNCVFTWAIISGGGTLSGNVGKTVTYCAPLDNPECVFSPTVGLYRDGVLCSSVTFGVSQNAASAYRAYWKTWTVDRGACSFEIQKRSYNCLGEESIFGAGSCDGCECDTHNVAMPPYTNDCDCACGYVKVGEDPPACPEAITCWRFSFAPIICQGYDGGFRCRQDELEARCATGSSCGTDYGVTIKCPVGGSSYTDVRLYSLPPNIQCCPQALM